MKASIILTQNQNMICPYKFCPNIFLLFVQSKIFSNIFFIVACNLSIFSLSLLLFQNQFFIRDPHAQINIFFLKKIHSFTVFQKILSYFHNLTSSTMGFYKIYNNSDFYVLFKCNK